MPNNARDIACDFMMNPSMPTYIDETIRKYQGCPTLAITRGGRIYIGWYAGGTGEPHIENFNLVEYSDDDGNTWSKPLFVIPSSKERCVHALDIELWTAPDGRLFVFWVQNNCHPLAEGETLKCSGNDPLFQDVRRDGWVFDDWEHACWVSVCDDPDAKEPVFSAPQNIGTGFLRCKPLVMNDGNWLCFNYQQKRHDRYHYTISKDNGKTFDSYFGSRKIFTQFDETMAYQKKDGTVHMFARTRTGRLAQSFSRDNGLTWDDTTESDIANPDTRFFISRTPSGRILLVNNDATISPGTVNGRTNMTLYLSDDDGETFSHKLCIDTRYNLSYPDVDFYGGKIYLTYDRERCAANEILFTKFTEDDIINGVIPDIKTVSKPDRSR